MSRRFGRNQKRRMREALAVEVQRVEQANQLASNRLVAINELRGELAEMRDFFSEVAQRVGRESSLLPGGEAGADLDDINVRQFRAIIPTQFPMYRPGLASIPQMSAMKAEILHRLEIQAVRDAFCSQIVARCYFHNVAVGIAFSESFVAKSTVEELARRISYEVPQHLAREMKKAAK